jgi:hypothetical protein
VKIGDWVIGVDNELGVIYKVLGFPLVRKEEDVFTMRYCRLLDGAEARESRQYKDYLTGREFKPAKDSDLQGFIMDIFEENKRIQS